MYNTILWDWNGTLLDDVGLAVQVMNEMLVEHGYSAINHQHYAKIFDFPVRDYYERLGFDLETHKFETLSDRFCGEFEARLHTTTLFSHVHSTLKSLRQHQHFVLSNTEQSALNRMLARFALEHEFTGIFGLSHNLASGKVAVGEELLNSHNVARDKAILIGDTTHDADVAAKLGIDCLLVATGHNARPRLEATGFKVLDSLHQVPEHVS